MKADENLLSYLKMATQIRCYDDPYSLAIKAQIIQELSMQIKNTLMRKE